MVTLIDKIAQSMAYEVKVNTPQIAYRVTAYRVDSAYRVGFTWNQIISGIFIVRTDLILGRYSVTYRVDIICNDALSRPRQNVFDGNDTQFWSARMLTD